MFLTILLGMSEILRVICAIDLFLFLTLTTHLCICFLLHNLPHAHLILKVKPWTDAAFLSELRVPCRRLMLCPADSCFIFCLLIAQATYRSQVR